MEKTIEQRYAITFCAKLNKSLADTHQMIQEAYGDAALSYSQVSRWLKFKMVGKRWRMTPTPDGRQPASDKGSRVHDLLNTDRRMIAETLSIPKTTVHDIVTDRKLGRPHSKGDRRYLAGAPRQRSQPHCSARPGVSGQAQLGNVAPALLQS
ncbi:protein GVQW3-like [Cryptotermes secundus]|uniref:protein GVQW3-like n=1 Tax=Cryptotermes secundus TaxID=105785 RepID=UPI000CD7D3A9|nr:protein GVQW3-like [Cryptotermes secundus]